MKYLAGLYIQEDQFARLRALCPTDHEFPRDWAEWSALVSKAQQVAEDEGMTAEALPLEIDHFERWCKVVGIVPCLDALRAYAIVRRAINEEGKKSGSA